jgi:hypothetical protein
MISFPSEVVIEALFVGILGRRPDVDGQTFYLNKIEERSLDLPGVVQALLASPERQVQFFTAEEAIRALYLAALGRAADEAGLASYLDCMKTGASLKILNAIAMALHTSPEHQNRLLPKELADRALIDHSPCGEFLAMIRHFVGVRRGLMVEVGLPDPSSSYSIDFLRLSGWHGILIESSPELHPAIQSRFSGLDFELIEASVLDRGIRANRAAATVPALRNVANLDLSDIQIGLASVLSAAKVPHSFEILAVSGALNTADIINGLIGTSEYRPALVIAELRPPQDWTDFSQVGLEAKIEQTYKIALSSEVSVFLARKAP